MLRVSVMSARIAPHQEMDAATLALGSPHTVVGLRVLVGEQRIGDLEQTWSQGVLYPPGAVVLRAGRDSVAEEPRPVQPGEGLAQILVSFLAVFGRDLWITPIPIETGLRPLFFTLGWQPAI